MSKISKKTRLILIIIIPIIIFSVFISFREKDVATVPAEVTQDFSKTENKQLEKEVIGNAPSMYLIVGSENLKFNFTKGDTLEKILLDATNRGEIDIYGKEYSGLGFFVTQINELKQGEGKNLFYYVNNEEASVGVSSYKPKEGDIVEWKLK